MSTDKWGFEVLSLKETKSKVHALVSEHFPFKKVASPNDLANKANDAADVT